MPTPTNSPTLDVPSSTGGFVVRERMRFAFFIRKRHLDLAPAAVVGFERLIDLFPPPTLSMFAIASGDWLRFSASGLKQQVRKRLVGKDPPINATASVAGDQANIPDVSVEYAGLAIDRVTFRQAATSFWFSVAPGLFEAHGADVLRLTRELVRLLGASAAYVDLALEGDRRRLQALARRYRAVDISDPRSVARDLEDKLPGVFWLNFLGSNLVDTLGGRGTIAERLSHAARIEDQPGGGLVITLGDVSSKGDVNQRAGGEADRVALARLADERGVLHIPRKVIYFAPEEDLTDAEAQERWHRRFLE